MAVFYPALSSNSFRNTIFALNIAAQKHFGDYLLEGDYSRIIYASNNYALRERSRNKPWSNLLLPFMSYRIRKITPNSDRRWWNHTLNVSGIYIPELKRKVRVQPITVAYDSSLFMHREDEMMYTFSEAAWDDSNETILIPQIQIDGEIVNMIGVLGIGQMGLEFESEYKENDWLERNKIHAVTLDFEFQTFIIKDNLDISIPDKVLFTFASMNDLDVDGSESHEELTELVIDHYAETNTVQE